MDFEDATYFAIATSIVGTVTYAPVTTLFFGASVAAVLAAGGDTSVDTAAFKVLLPVLFFAAAKSAKYVLHTAIPAAQSRLFHCKRSLKTAARTAAAETANDVANHPLAAASALGVGYAVFNSTFPWYCAPVVIPVTYLLVKKVVDVVLLLRWPTMERAVQAGSLGVAAAIHAFVDVVDRVTDAALDLVTETLPRAAFRCCVTAFATTIAAVTSVRNKPQQAYLAFRKKYKKVTLTGLAANAAAAAYGLTMHPIHQAAELVTGIPKEAALSYVVGLAAGILQVPIFHAVYLLMQMAENPTDAWTQMTAFEKASEVVDHLMKIAPYLPTYTGGTALLVVFSVMYAGLFLYLFRPENVQFEFNLQAEKHFVTVTVPRLAKSARAAVASKISFVAAALATKFQSLHARALATLSAVCERIGAVSSRGAGSDAESATASSTATSNGSKAVPAGASFRTWLEVVATHPMVSYLAFPLCCAFLMQQHSSSSASAAAAAVTQLLELYSSIEASVSASPQVVSLVAASRVACTKAAFFAVEILSPTWTEMLQSATAMLGPLVLTLRSDFIGSNDSAFLTLVQSNILQPVPSAAVSLVTKAAALSATVQEFIQRSIKQVLHAAVEWDIAALARLASSVASAAGTETASYATNLFQVAARSLSEAAIIGADVAAVNFGRAVSAATSCAASTLSALLQVASSIGPTLLKLHGAISSIVDDIPELIAPRLASLAIASSASASKVSMIAAAIQEFAQHRINQVQMIGQLPEGFGFYASVVLAGFLLYAYRELAVDAAKSIVHRIAAHLCHRLTATTAIAATNSEMIPRSKRSSTKSKARKNRGRRNSHRSAAAASEVTSKSSTKMNLLSAAVTFAVAVAFAVHGLRSHGIASTVVSDVETSVQHEKLLSNCSVEVFVHPPPAMPKPSSLETFHFVNHSTAAILFSPSGTPSLNFELPQAAMPVVELAPASFAGDTATPEMSSMPRASCGDFISANASQLLSQSDPLTSFFPPASGRRTHVSQSLFATNVTIESSAMDLAELVESHDRLTIADATGSWLKDELVIFR